MNEELAQAAERLALVLTSHGLQRMTARVLAALLFTDQLSLTMRELGDQLQASSGAISGALKTLGASGLVERVPVPGSRREHYRLRDDAWTVLYTHQNEAVAAMQSAAAEGIALAGADSPAGRRLAEMRDFYAFVFAEIPELLERWAKRR
ncbi:GbsR/MarR family transcriptional regulator [Mycolicibacterium palauense]|uniref:GbsR/MarR family transcriptional regulator n=1 Tax=Mycolicibacterium palauense TaxID=2034511 RepID=UPI002481D51C|nr:MarR family transcriptional regulator [Mycolicibacterium palauense]